MKVSILIPLYNQEDLIQKCLDSIPKRSDIEIIVIDDCSTDNSFNIVKEKYPHVKLIKNPINLGVGLTRNRLLDVATGEYVFFLDSDDYIYPDVFSDIVDNDLKNDIILKPMCERNDGHKWFSGVHRGDFVKRSFIGDTRHPNKRCNEDSDFKYMLKNKPGFNLRKVNKVVYHYNEPRLNSLTWNYRKSQNMPGYDKGIEEWEEVHKK